MNLKLKKIFANYQGRGEELIPLLQQTQQEFGYLSEEVMLAIAKFTKVPESQVYGVATFYAQFRFSPIGRQHVMVCRGTACHVRGATSILDKIKSHLSLEEGASTTDGEYSLETVACIGCCGLAPCITINGKVEAKVTPKKIPQLLPKKGE
jgi:NADH-quinone oxidoreductase subunit E